MATQHAARIERTLELLERNQGDSVTNLRHVLDALRSADRVSEATLLAEDILAAWQDGETPDPPEAVRRIQEALAQNPLSRRDVPTGTPGTSFIPRRSSGF